MLLLFLPFSGNTQENKRTEKRIYKFDWKKDLIIAGSGIGLSILGEIATGNVNPSTLAEVNALDPMDVNGFDRGAITNDSETARDISDVILYSSFSLPAIAYFLPKCRFEGVSIGLMAVEAVLLTNGVTNITKGLARRTRPLVYNANNSIEERMLSGSRLSFFSGHTSVTTAMFFLAGSVITDVHPNMKNKYLVWTAAATIPAAVAYLRFEGGKHFPTDVITGYAVGGAIGYLIPRLHKQKKENKKLRIGTYGLAGLSLNLNLN
jgi:Membrane-associated phospholipid phosphatase